MTFVRFAFSQAKRVGVFFSFRFDYQYWQRLISDFVKYVSFEAELNILYTHFRFGYKFLKKQHNAPVSERTRRRKLAEIYLKIAKYLSSLRDFSLGLFIVCISCTH